MTGHLSGMQIFLRRQSLCESYFDELFKRSFAFVDPRANQSAFPAIQNERGKCASRKVLGDLPLCLFLGNDVHMSRSMVNRFPARRSAVLVPFVASSHFPRA